MGTPKLCHEVNILMTAYCISKSLALMQLVSVNNIKSSGTFHIYFVTDCIWRQIKYVMGGKLPNIHKIISIAVSCCFCKKITSQIQFKNHKFLYDSSVGWQSTMSLQGLNSRCQQGWFLVQDSGEYLFLDSLSLENTFFDSQ